MSRKEPLGGVSRQVQDAAVLSLNPSKIASCLDKFNEVLALPRFAHQPDEAKPLDDLARARDLVDAIKVELDLMKRPRAGETELETSEREWRAELIDGTYALTSEWQEAGNIMQRRRDLIDNSPGPTVSMRTHIESREREIHEELAVRLARDPSSKKDKEADILFTLEAFFVSIEVHLSEPNGQETSQRLLMDFGRFSKLRYEAQYVVERLISKLKQQGRSTDALALVASVDVGPSFTSRESSLLSTAVEESSKRFDPFLEYIETRSRGRKLLEKWSDWVVREDISEISNAYRNARELLLDQDEEMMGKEPAP